MRDTESWGTLHRPAFETLEPRLLLNGTISGQLWHDFNGDSLRDAGDTGLNGWTVELVDVASGTVVDTQVTASVDVDADGVIDPQTEAGLYSFTSVAAGKYLVQSGSASWSQTQPLEVEVSAEFVQVITYSDGVPGLYDVLTSDVSPDGRHVYAVGGSNSTSSATQPNDGITVFSRDQATGELTVEQAIFDDGTNALDHSTSVRVSPDGLYVYVTSSHDSAIGVYTRDVVNGHLTHLQTLAYAQDGIDSLYGAYRMSLSPDGEHIYVSSYNGAWNGSTWEGSLGVFRRDQGTGLLSLQQEIHDGDNGAALKESACQVTASQDGKYVYAVESRSRNTTVFARDTATGDLTATQVLVTMGDSLVISPFGRHAYVAEFNREYSFVAVYDRNEATGALTEITGYGYGYDEAESLVGLSSVVISQDGLHVLATTSGGIVGFERDVITGELNIENAPNGFDSGRRLRISPDGNNLYTVSTSEHFIQVFGRVFTTPFITLDVADSDALVDISFGYVPPVTSISGQVFADRNADGLHDVGEFGLNGWTVELLDAGGLVVDTQITRPIDSNGDYILDVDTEHGAYEFTGMLPGNYEVRQVLQADWMQTTTPTSHAVSIAYGPVTTGIDFGNVGYGDMAGQVWYDIDRDGIQGAGEDGRDGVTVELVDTVSGAVVATQVTAGVDVDGNGTIDPHTEAGLYSFAGVVAGDYTVQPVVQPGWDYTGPLVATGEVEQAQVIDGIGALDGAATVVASDDGRHVYVASSRGDSVTVFALDAVTGELSLIQVFQDGVDGIAGLDYVRALTLSSDELHLYATSASDNAISIFSRDATTGELTFVDMITTDVADAHAVIVSDDGAYLYCSTDGAIDVFSRNPATGGLAFVQRLGTADLPAGYTLNSVGAMAISDDGGYLYATTYGSVVTLARSAATGQVSFIESLAATADASDVVVSHDGESVYVTGQYGGDVLVYARDTVTGQLGLIQHLYVGGYAVSVDLSPDNSHVYVGRRGAGVVLVYDRSESTGELTLLQTLADGVDGVDGLDGMTSVFVSGDGAYVYSTSDRDDALAVFERLEAALPVSVTVSVGGVVAVESLGVSDTVAVSGQVFADRNSDGLHDVGDFGLDGWTVELVDAGTGAVVATQTSAGVDVDEDGVIDADTEAGLYSFEYVLPGDYEVRQVVQADWAQTSPAISHLISPASGQDIADIDFSNVAYGGVTGQLWEDINGDGQRHAGENGADGVAVELVDTANGAAVATQVTFSDDLDGSGTIDPVTEMGLYNFAGMPVGSYEVRVSPTSGWVQTSPVVVPGELGMIEVIWDGVDGVAGLDGGTSLTFSSDGAYAYTTSWYGGVAVFARDTASGQLSFIEVYQDGVDGVDGIYGATAAVVSADGGHVYVVSAGDNALTMFSRDVATGRLTYVESMWAYSGGVVDGLAGARSLVLSPDGLHIYVAGKDDDALGVFARDPSTGQVSFIEAVKDTDFGVDGLDAVWDVDISPDGAYVYAASNYDGSVAVFARDAGTGRLSFVQIVQNDLEIDGLGMARTVAVSGDGAHVYVGSGSSGAGSLVVFSRHAVTGELTFVEVIKGGGEDVDDGLGHITEIAISEDGEFLYTSSWADHTVLVFARDTITGRLHNVGSMTDDVDGVDGLWQTNSVAVSGDGSHVYALGYTDDALASFYQVHVIGRTNVEVTAGGVAGDVSFGAADGVTASGQVFGDFNNDGVRDAAERGRDGRAIQLLDAFTGRLLDTRVTASIDLDGNGVIDPISESGLYSFTDLPPRQYKAKLVSDGWTQTTPASPHWLNISSGDADIAGRDFGVFATASVSGQVFADRNTDGLHDVGDFGLSGWIVELVETAGGTVVASQLTASIDIDADTIIDPDTEEGLYSFTDVMPGNYEIRQVVPAGWVRTVPAGPQAVLLDVGQSVTDVDLGAIAFGSVAGQVWEDTSGDGVQDASEVGVDGMTVALIDAAGGAVVATQVTASVDLDADGTIDPQTEAGLYSFTGVPVGEYEVQPAVSSGWAITAPIVATGQLGPVQVVQGSYLDGVRTIVISGDGKYLYAALALGDGITVFARDAATGELQIVQTLSNGDDGLTLNGVAAIAISSDDAHVYVAAYQDDVLLAFARDAVTGELSFVQALTDNVGGVDGLQTVYELTVSDDGLHVYTAAHNDNAISVFARDTITGELTFVQMLREGVDDIDSLGGVYSLTVSADGAHVYAVSVDDDAITVFARDAATGQLTLVQTVWDGVDGVTGLDGLNSVVVSDDGAHVYTTASSSNSVVVFERDAATGELSFVQCLTDGIGGVDGLDGAHSPAFIADGSQVYVPASREDAVSVFSRDAVTGELDLINVIRDGVDGIDGLEGAIFAAVSDDDAYVYVAGHDDDAIAVFERIYAPGPVDVTLTAGEIVTDVDLGVIDPVTVTGQVFADADNDGVRDVAEVGQDGWTVELVRTDTGDVIATRVTASVDVDEDGMIDPVTEAGLYVFEDVAQGQYDVRLALPEGYSLTFPATSTYGLTFASSDPDIGNLDFGLSTLTEVRGQVWDDLNRDGLHDSGELGLDGWTVELVDAASGSVVDTQVTASVDLDESGAIDPQTEAGSYTFANVAAGFYRVRQVPQAGWVQTSPEQPPGELNFLQVLKSGVDGVDGLGGVMSVTVSGDGAHVYAASNNDNAVVVFARNAVTGELSFVQTLWDGVGGVDGLNGAWSAAVSSDGAHVYVASVSDSAVAVFTRDAVTGELSFVQVLKDGVDGVDGLDYACLVTISGDGAHVYVAGSNDNAVAVFARDVVTGELSFVQVLKDGVAGVDGLAGIRSVTVSGDGAHVYTASINDNAVAAFTRNAVTGELSFVQALKDGVGGVDGLDGAESVTVSGDGAHVYVASKYDDAVAVFSRDGVTGELTFIQVLKDSVDGVDGLDYAFCVTTSGDGAYVYVASAMDDAVAVFTRDAVTGELSLVEILKDGVGGVEGLDAAYSVTVSGDGAHVYASGNYDDAVVVFERIYDVPRPIDVDIAAYMVIADADFGVFRLAAISGQVFGDLDGNGVRNGVEVGIDGWTVELVDPATGGVIATATTASEDLDGDGIIDPATERGRYRFAGLVQDDYEVRQIVPAGWQQTAPMGAEERAFAAEVVGGAVTVHEFDVASGAIVNSFAGPQAVAMSGYQGLAVGPDSLFYVDANDWLTPTLWELNLDTGAAVDSDPLTFGAIYAIKGLAYLDGLLYIQYMPDQVAVWDPASDSFVQTLTISAAVMGGLTGAGDLGVLFDSNAAGEIIAIDPTDGSVLSTFATGLGALDGGLAYVGGELLGVGSGIGSLVHRIDPSTGAVLGSFALGVSGSVVGLGGDMPNLSVPVNYAISLGPSDVLDGQDFANLAPAVTGDFNGDGLVDSLDIDLLYANQGDAAFDLDGDNDADWDDMDVLVRDVLNTEYGDANLDGIVNATDLAIMKVNFTSSGVGWSGGDFNGSGLVNLTDLSILAAYFGFESPGGGLSVSAAALLGESDAQAEPILASASVIHQLSPPAAIDEYAIDSHLPLSSGQQVGVESIEAGRPAKMLADSPASPAAATLDAVTSVPSSPKPKPRPRRLGSARPPQPLRVPGASVRGEPRASGIPSPLPVGLSAASVRPPVGVDLTAAALLQSGALSVADILGEVEPIF